MHIFDGGFLFGMHFGGLFWIAMFVTLLGVFEPIPRPRRRDTPGEILRRRYAAGEIATEEHEDRKKRLDEDSAGK